MTDERTADQIWFSAHEAVKGERDLNLEVLRHLGEIEDRKIHLERGYPSLFEVCVKEFKYSPAAAHRRIEAMRLIREIPEVHDRLKDGVLTLSTIAQTQGFFRVEKKKNRSYSAEQKRGILVSLEGKSAREVERELASRNPDVARWESMKAISATQARLTMTISHELREKLDELKDIMAHQNPAMTYEGLIELLVEQKFKEYRKRNGRSGATGDLQVPDKVHGQARDIIESNRNAPLLPTSETGEDSTETGSKTARTRFIPAATRRSVWQRDGGRCSYVDPQTRHRCGSRAYLQIDHVHPYALGGPTRLENLRLLCGHHNRHRAEKTFAEGGTAFGPSRRTAKVPS